MIGISVIIPVRNEADNVGALLDDLLAQSLPPAEVLVVDTGSTDGSAAIVAQVAAQDRRVRLLSAPGAYPGGARNEGLRAARSEWVAFVDGAMRVGAEWLERLAASVGRDRHVDAVLGGLEVVAETRRQRAAALAYVPARRPTPDGGMWRGFCLPSSLVRLDLARAIGGFPAELRSGEDLVFFQRLQNRARIAYAPDAVVRWTHASDSRAVWRRFRTYAEHSFRAGLMGDWFAVVSRRYLWVAALSGPALPIGVAGLLLARAAVSLRRKPEFADTSLPSRALQLVEVASYLGLIDAASAAAWWHWRSHAAPRLDLTARPLAPADSTRSDAGRFR